jgi:hypothetical protein
MDFSVLDILILELWDGRNMGRYVTVLADTGTDSCRDRVCMFVSPRYQV